VINRSESQLIARDQNNQVRKASSKRPSRSSNLKRSDQPQHKKAS
jgi:hypothetical protein